MEHNFASLRSRIAFRPAVSLLIGLLLVASPALRAQSSKAAKPDKPGRRLVHKVEPVYPQDLKRLNIGGTVKLDIQISAHGSVERVQIVGGNPILADSAARAVKQWQYEPAEAATSILLNVEFNPRR
jgi:protein TonB